MIDIAERTHGGQMLSEWDTCAAGAIATLPNRATLSGTACDRIEWRVPFHRGTVIVRTLDNPPGWVEPVVEGLRQLMDLPPNWDTYGAPRIDARIVSAAVDGALRTFKQHTPPPSVVPTSRGGVQFEWHIGGIDLEVEFVSATSLCVLFENSRTGECWEQVLTSQLGPLAKAIDALPAAD